MHPQICLDAGRGRPPVNLGVTPMLCELAERDLAARTVDVAASQLRRLDRGEVLLGVDPALERLGAAITLGCPPPCSPPARHSRDRPHAPAPSTSERSPGRVRG